MICVQPKMRPIPEGASRTVRLQMYLEYADELVHLNPRGFLPVGVKKRWWHLRLEHPRTTHADLVKELKDIQPLTPWPKK